VLIYEQIKHSIRDGMKPVRALEHGYDRAFITIVDANLTTIIAGIVLLAMGSGAVQGFAVTLIIGILASMFTAIIGSRAILEVVYARPGRNPPTRLSI
jgi:preprotein translocase subunit SecD